MNKRVKREVVATLVRAGKAELARDFVGASNQYWSVDVNKGLDMWWNSLGHAIRSAWEGITFQVPQRGGSAAFWFRQFPGTLQDQDFLLAVTVSPTAGNTKLSVEAKIIDGLKKGEKKTLGTVRLDAAPYEVAAKVNDWLSKVFKAELKMVGASLVQAGRGHHMRDGKDYHVDTAFINQLASAWPEASKGLTHMGFGEFAVKMADGTEIEFDRMRGKAFQGQSGRSHKLYDNVNGKAVKELISRMEKKNLSELVKG